jgi:hypothetical protein
MSTLPDRGAGAYVTWWRLHTAGAGGPVDLDRHPLADNSRVDQVKRYVRAGVGEERMPSPITTGYVSRIVDPVVQQPADHAAAAVRLQLTRQFVPA